MNRNALVMEELGEWARRLASAATWYNFCVDRFGSCRGRLSECVSAERDFRRQLVEAHIEGIKTQYEVMSGGGRGKFLKNFITRVTVARRDVSVSCRAKLYGHGEGEET